MYIFNLNTKPYIIVTEKELLFHQEIYGEGMQRYLLENIESISSEHSYDEHKKLLVYLNIKISEQSSPVILTISSLDTPVEEILTILTQELHNKIELTLFPSKCIPRTKNKKNIRKFLLAAIVMVCIGLYSVHTMLIPSLESLEINALKKRYEEGSGLCSVKAKAAMLLSENNAIEVKTYCGILGIWKESSHKTIPKQFLETEFSTLNAHDYIMQAQESYDDNKSNRALIQITNALYLEPQNYQTYILLSQVQERLGFSKKALNSLLQAAVLNPSSPTISDAIASLYLKDNNYKKAYLYADKTVELDSSAAHLVKLAKIETYLEMTEKAIAHYEYSLQKDPDDIDVLAELSLLYWERKDFKKFSDILLKIYQLHPTKVLNFLNYYETTLLTPASLNQNYQETFLDEYKNSKEAMIVYDMLNIIRLAIKNTDTQAALTIWSQAYKDERLNWPLQRLRAWLDTLPLEIDHVQHIQNTIGFFIGYQQAYKINHNEVD